MLVSLMGFLDLHAAILLCAIAWGVEVPMVIAIIIAASLLVKGLAYIKDIGSLQDIGAVIIIVLGLFMAVPPPVLFAAAAVIGFKGLCSLAG